MATSSIAFSVNGASQRISLPEKGSDLTGSVFVAGLPKAGSTLLNSLMRPLCRSAGLSPFSLHQELHDLGLPANRCPPEVVDLYDPFGYAYLGYRGLSDADRLPSFANGRIIALIRDPRDMVVSLYFSEAYSHRPPGSKADSALAIRFVERRQQAQQALIDDYVLQRARNVERTFLTTMNKLARLSHRIWRYEDVIFDKRRWTEEMIDYLALDVRNDVVDRVVAANDIMPIAENKDEHIRRVTPGDHVRKLKPETIEEVTSVFGDILSRYGYS